MDYFIIYLFAATATSACKPQPNVGNKSIILRSQHPVARMAIVHLTGVAHHRTSSMAIARSSTPHSHINMWTGCPGNLSVSMRWEHACRNSFLSLFFFLFFFFFRRTIFANKFTHVTDSQSNECPEQLLFHIAYATIRCPCHACDGQQSSITFVWVLHKSKSYAQAVRSVQRELINN